MDQVTALAREASGLPMQIRKKALDRKPCELLLYPGESHGLRKPKNQLDITRRIKAWFDSYLKPGQALKNDPVDHFSEGASRREGNNN